MMRLNEQSRHALARAGVLLAVGSCVWVLRGLPPESTWLHGALLAMLATFTVGIVLPARWQGARLQLSLLAVDLLALGIVGSALVQGTMPGADARIPFLCGYLVATLVAIVGDRAGAAILGTLGGTMVLGVITALTVKDGWTLQPFLLSSEVLLLVATSFLIVWIAGSLKREARRGELAHRIARELREREAASAELVSFTQALADTSTLAEVADAVLRHLRGHTDLSVRSVVLESEGESVALWEEAGRLDADHVERRRLRVQQSLARAGSHFLVRRLRCHATAMDVAPLEPAFRTAVDIPVKIGGRVAGVLFLGDARTGALPPDRIGVLVDVARRTSEAIRRHERQRDHENRRTALLLRQMHEGVLLLGTGGTVLLANPAARAALDACTQESSQAGDQPEVSPRIGDLTLAELADTPPGVSRRFRATLNEEGRSTPTQLACTSICVLDRGQRIGTLVTLTDVTEEELARHRIIQAERTTLVGQTLAGVAHELNNPLAALIGYADLLRTEELPERIEKPVHQMREQAVRAARIVRNLLNFARRRNPERVPTAIGDLIEGTIDLFAYEARLTGVEVEVKIADDLPRVLADMHALQQVLVNLVQNALHVLDDWQGTRVLTISASADDAHVSVTVSDSGPGVPDELRTRVFESFFTTKGATKGTGLGLALSRAIAQDHGGELLLAPDTGSGASFTLRLPRHRAGAVAMTAPCSAVEEAPLVPERVLVVDDEASVRETLVAQLGAMGARVDSAANATEALRMVRTGRYDALIVDIRMPGASGLELHERIADIDPLLADRVVFITGDFVNDELLCRALDTGRLLLEKPFTMNELSAALSKTISGPTSAGDASTNEMGPERLTA